MGCGVCKKQAKVNISSLKIKSKALKNNFVSDTISVSSWTSCASNEYLSSPRNQKEQQKASKTKMNQDFKLDQALLQQNQNYPVTQREKIDLDIEELTIEKPIIVQQSGIEKERVTKDNLASLQQNAVQNQFQEIQDQQNNSLDMLKPELPKFKKPVDQFNFLTSRRNENKAYNEQIQDLENIYLPQDQADNFQKNYIEFDQKSYQFIITKQNNQIDSIQNNKGQGQLQTISRSKPTIPMQINFDQIEQINIQPHTTTENIQIQSHN